ncbi:MAG TPA: hypothetical protein VH575_27155 [Gemmataceae bacterium]
MLPTRDRQGRTRRAHFVTFRCSANGDPVLAREVEAFLRWPCRTARRSQRREAVGRDLDRQLGRRDHDRHQHHADFAVLKQREQHAALFGFYVLQTEKRLSSGKVADWAAQRPQHHRDIPATTARRSAVSRNVPGHARVGGDTR